MPERAAVGLHACIAFAALMWMGNGCRALIAKKDCRPAIIQRGKSTGAADPCKASPKPVALHTPEAVQPDVPDQLEAEIVDLISHHIVEQRPLTASLPTPKLMAPGSDAPSHVLVSPPS